MTSQGGPGDARPGTASRSGTMTDGTRSRRSGYLQGGIEEGDAPSSTGPRLGPVHATGSQATGTWPLGR